MVTAKAKDQKPAAPAKPGEKPKRKIPKKFLYVGIGLPIFVLILYVGLVMPKGTMKFGICQVFIEKTLTYPIDFKVSSVYEKGDVVKMDYTFVNEYGEYILNTAQCSFKPDPAQDWDLIEVQVNKVKLPDDQVASFNLTIPFILSNPPDLTLPIPISDNLMDLQR